MIIKDKIKQIISDFHQRGIPELVDREYNWIAPEGKIFSIIGVRRSGKTFSFYQIIKEILEKGGDLRDVLFINFEDDRLYPVNKNSLSLILEAYYELYPAKKDTTVYIFFDEIQNIDGWQRFARRILDTEKVRVYVTGSSSKMLSKELSTALRGRTAVHEVFPFCFTEYLRYKNISKEAVSSKQKAGIINAFEKYLYIGGFPEIFDVKEDERVNILQEYINLIIYKDLIERHNIKNHALVKYLIKYFLVNTANLFSINKMYNDLKSQGYKVSKDAIFNYLSYLEDAYCFFSVPIYSESIRVRHANPRKIYSVDHGLVTACVWSAKENTGRLLENLIFTHLKRVSPWRGIFYYVTESGREVDFIVLDKGKITALIQSAESMTDAGTMKREIESLLEAMEELKISSGTILTRDEGRIIKTNKKTVKIIPAWEWLLNLKRTPYEKVN